jgi:hypothetical protein
MSLEAVLKDPWELEERVVGGKSLLVHSQTGWAFEDAKGGCRASSTWHLTAVVLSVGVEALAVVAQFELSGPINIAVWVN